MRELTADQRNEKLKEDGPLLWWCRRFCNACNGHKDTSFWCAFARTGEPCAWSQEEVWQEIRAKIDPKYHGNLDKETSPKDQKDPRYKRR